MFENDHGKCFKWFGYIWSAIFKMKFYLLSITLFIDGQQITKEACLSL